MGFVPQSQYDVLFMGGTGKLTKISDHTSSHNNVLIHVTFFKILPTGKSKMLCLP